jgi:hypothetical protein
MSNNVFPFEQRTFRGIDSNSLLRMYDFAKALFTKSQFQQERARADKTMQRIAKELRKRNVPW